MAAGSMRVAGAVAAGSIRAAAAAALEAAGAGAAAARMRATAATLQAAGAAAAAARMRAVSASLEYAVEFPQDLRHLHHLPLARYVSRYQVPQLV